jgi:hypothetical protein
LASSDLAVIARQYRATEQWREDEEVEEETKEDEDEDEETKETERWGRGLRHHHDICSA